MPGPINSFIYLFIFDKEKRSGQLRTDIASTLACHGREPLLVQPGELQRLGWGGRQQQDPDPSEAHHVGIGRARRGEGGASLGNCTSRIAVFFHVQAQGGLPKPPRTAKGHLDGGVTTSENMMRKDTRKTQTPSLRRRTWGGEAVRSCWPGGGRTGLCRPRLDKRRSADGPLEGAHAPCDPSTYPLIHPRTCPPVHAPACPMVCPPIHAPARGSRSMSNPRPHSSQLQSPSPTLRERVLASTPSLPCLLTPFPGGGDRPVAC